MGLIFRKRFEEAAYLPAAEHFVKIIVVKRFFPVKGVGEYVQCLMIHCFIVLFLLSLFLIIRDMK